MLLHPLSIIVSLTLPALIFTHIFGISYDNENRFQPCEDEPDNYISKWFNIYNFMLKAVSKSKTYLLGDFEALVDFKPNTTFYMDIEGNETEDNGDREFFQVERHYICQGFSNPRETWYKISVFDDGVCRLRRGSTIVKLVNVPKLQPSNEDDTIAVPIPVLVGGYELKIRFGDADDEENHICFKVYAHSYFTLTEGLF